MVSTRSASRSGTPAAALPPNATPKTPRASKATTYVHRPSTVLLAWLAVSLPLVAWDTAYMLLRPHTMPGGWLHKPIWSLYDLYGRVDLVYGVKAWEDQNGFSGAQSFMNLVESLMYCAYLWMWWAEGTVETKGANAGGRKVVKGRAAGRAVVICFSAAVMTFSKTALYWLCEYYSSYEHIGHNDLYSLVVLWIIPNGLWLVFSAYMINELGTELVGALAMEPVKRS